MARPGIGAVQETTSTGASASSDGTLSPWRANWARMNSIDGASGAAYPAIVPESDERPAPAHRGLEPREAATLALLSAIWGSSFLFIKVAVGELGPAAVVALRLLVATGAMVGWLTLRRGRAGVRAMLAGIRPADALTLAATGSSVPFLLIAWAETRITSSLAGILNAATPLFTAVLAMALASPDRIRGWRVSGLLLGFAGVALVAGGGLGGRAPAVGAMLLAAFLYGVSAHVARRRFAGVEPQAIALAQTLAGAGLAVPIALAVGGPMPSALPSAAAVGSLLALSVGGTAVGYFLYHSLVSTAGAQQAVAVTYLAPVAAVVYGRLLLGERVGLGALAGMGLIIAGQLIVSARTRPLPSRRVSALLAWVGSR
jgi:drug/metabolite transporter (DMT)-like permease